MNGNENDSPFAALRQMRAQEQHGTQTNGHPAPSPKPTPAPPKPVAPVAPVAAEIASEAEDDGEGVIVGRALPQNVYIDSAMEEAILAITCVTISGTRNKKPSRSLAAYYLMSLGVAEWERQGRPGVPREIARRRRR